MPSDQLPLRYDEATVTGWLRDHVLGVVAERWAGAGGFVEGSEEARQVRDAMSEVQKFRHEHGDAYYFNWRLVIPSDFQMPFEATHASMSELNVDENLPAHELAAVLRRVFSGIVSGNVREDTIEQIEQQGPFTIKGSARIMGMLDELLTSFVAQKRMKISGGDYQPCYRVS